MSGIDARDTIPTLDVDPFSLPVLENPYPTHELLREAGPFVWLARYGVGSVARYDEVRAVLLNWEVFSSARGVGMEDFAKDPRVRLPSIILEADPPQHARSRMALNKVLSPATVRRLRASFEDQADALVGRLVEKREFDACVELAEAYPLSVFPDAVGMAEAGREKLLPHADLLFNSFGPRNGLFEAAKAGANHAWIDAQGRREYLQPGGLGMAMHELADAGELTAEEAAMLVRAMLQAGLDTTINALGAAICCLTRNPLEWRKLRADASLARGAFEEAIRLESPVQTFFRTATRRTDVGGATVEEGQKVLMMLAAANRDPRRWPQPDRYDITRNTSGHVGFGAGIHMCVGQLLARLEGEAVLTALARRVAGIEFTAEPVRRYNNTLRGLARMPVRVRAP